MKSTTNADEAGAGLLDGAQVCYLTTAGRRTRREHPNAVGRLGTVEEVADLVTFLASPRASYISGANYRIDGAGTTSVN